jgi:hypothetical protein
MLPAEDAAWLADYEEERGRVQDRGASRSHKVAYTEESAEAVGTGPAAEMAAAGMMSREEGRRYDSLIAVGITALRTATDTYEKMCGQLLQRNQQLEEAHVEMMRAYRMTVLARVKSDAEAEAGKIIREAEEKAEATAEDADPITKLAGELLPSLLPLLTDALAKKAAAG